MRSLAPFLLLVCCLGCRGTGPSFTAPTGTTVRYAIADQAETRDCDSPVTPQATCRISLTARIVLGEMEGREWQIRSVRIIVRDQVSGQDLHAVPAELKADELRQVAGTSVLPAYGAFTIPLKVQFLVGQAPYYVDGPHELLVTLGAVIDGTLP